MKMYMVLLMFVLGATHLLGGRVCAQVDSVAVNLSSGPILAGLASVNGTLHGDECDSVRIVGLIFTWGSEFPPFQVPNLNWKAGAGQNVQQNFPLPPAAPGFPKDAHVVYVVYPDGTTRILNIDSLIAGRFYELAPSCGGTGVGPDTQLPERTIIEQNYPNPWNPSTTIRYGLPHVSFVTLTVYNTLGQQVAQLVNEQQPAGYRDVVFHGDGLASGVYFCRLQAGDFVASKKLLLLK